MYLHLGGDTVVPARKIVSIFDMENTTISSDTQNFLRMAALEGRTETVTDEMPKAFVVVNEGMSTRIYITSISAATLYKRNLIGGVQENV